MMGSEGMRNVLRRPRVRAGLLVALVLATALATTAGIGAANARAGGAGDNRALVDVDTTSAVTGQISDAVQNIFTFDPRDMARAEQAAQRVLTGDAVGQYDQLYGRVKKQAPEQGLAMTTTVKSLAVRTLNGDRADVLVFADQRATRPGVAQPGVGGAQVQIAAQRVDGQWKIAGITVL
jgi:Mce-associated membrane protein